jgi:hypothetical protein
MKLSTKGGTLIKTTRALGGLLWAVWPMVGQAEEVPVAPPRHTVVLARPGVLGEVGASVEYAVSGHVALAGGVMGQWLTQEQRSEAGGSSFQRLGLSVDPGVHVYFAGRAPEGFWVGAHAEGWWVHSSNRTWLAEGGPGAGQEASSSSRSYGASVRGGYTLVLAPGFAAQVGLGFSALASSPGLLGVGRAWSVSPRVSLGVGWAFGGS